MEPELEEADWACCRFNQLKFIGKKRLAALCHGKRYQKGIARAYDKKVKPRTSRRSFGIEEDLAFRIGPHGI